jgi:hypothetical protein
VRLSVAIVCLFSSNTQSDDADFVLLVFFLNVLTRAGIKFIFAVKVFLCVETVTVQTE